MKKKIMLHFLAVSLVTLVGCGPPLGYGDPQTRSFRGAAAGAAVGALLTPRGERGLTRNAWAGAAIGGLLGAATAPRPHYYPQPAPPPYYGYGY